MSTNKETKLYLELQMEELKEAHKNEEEVTTKKDTKKQDKNAEIAKLYEDAAEYENDLEEFEKELDIVNNNELTNIAKELNIAFPNSDRNYEDELQTVLEIGWTNLVEVEKTHPKSQLDMIKENKFIDNIEILKEYEDDIRGFLVKRWENLIAIKKDHIKQELDDIKTMGLKPKFVKRIYKQFHGIA